MKSMWIIQKETEQCLRETKVWYTKWLVFPGMWICPRPETKGYRIIETELDLCELSQEELEKIYKTGETKEKEEKQ